MGATRRFRVCVIGAGSMANNVHYPSLASFDEVEISAIIDLDPKRVEDTGERFGVPTDRRFPVRLPTDYRQVIESRRPDAVYVIGQPHLMYDLWTWCLEQGLHLYIEKPLGLTIHQARSLAHLAREHGCITQVSHQRRSAPIVAEMRRRCLERGPITHGVVEFYKCALEPFRGARDHMMDDCTHSVDTARWICGGRVAGIESRCRRIGVPDINWIGATLHFDNGSSCYVINSWSSGRRIFRVQMHARGICVDAEVEGKAFLYADGDYEGTCFDTREIAGSNENYVYGGFRAKNREFIDSLISGQEMTSSPFSDALETMEVCERILAQALLSGE